MNQPNLVRQKDPHGCQVACLAMIVGCSYEQAITLYEFHEPRDFNVQGLSRFWIEAVLWDLGYSLRVLTKSRRIRAYDWPKNDREEWPVKPWTDMHFCEVFTAEGSPMHCVILLRDGSVLDPAFDLPRRFGDYYSVQSITGVEPPAKLDLPPIYIDGWLTREFDAGRRPAYNGAAV